MLLDIRDFKLEGVNMTLLSKITVSMLLTVLLVGATFWATPTFAFNAKGIDCRAANLNQALQGIGTDQFGVRNNSDTDDFFVVCPLHHDGGDHDTIQMQPLFPSGGGDMGCVLRLQNFSTGAFIFVTVNISETEARPSFVSETFGPFSAFTNPNVTIVCPLGPDEGIEWLWFF